MALKTEGVLECSPLSMKFTDLSRLAFDKEIQYGISFAFANDANRAVATFNGALNSKNEAYQWQGTADLDINSFTTDKIVTISLVKKGGGGGSEQDDEVICVGAIPADIIQTIYEAPNLRIKSQLVEMKNIDNERCGMCRVKIAFNNEKRTF